VNYFYVPVDLVEFRFSLCSLLVRTMSRPCGESFSFSACGELTPRFNPAFCRQKLPGQQSNFARKS